MMKKKLKKAKKAKKKAVKKKPVKKVAKKKPKPSKAKQLVQACKLWDQVTTKAHHGKYKIPEKIRRYRYTIYSDGDYNELQCRITDDIAELTVGGSAGHKAKVNLGKKTLDYYDTRDANNTTMMGIFKWLKLKCKQDNVGVHCKGLTTKKKIDGAFKALAMPASMDFRRSSCLNMDSRSGCAKTELQFFKNGPAKDTLKAPFK